MSVTSIRTFDVCDACGKCYSGSAAQSEPLTDAQGKTIETVAQLMRCGFCLITPYCSIECQKKEWPKHQRTCTKVAERDKEEFKKCVQRAIKNAHANLAQTDRAFGLGQVCGIMDTTQTLRGRPLVITVPVKKVAVQERV